MDATTISGRIQLIIDNLGYSNNAFGRSVNSSSARVSNIVTGRNEPNYELLKQILSIYKNVSSDWLMLGKGNMKIDPNAPLFASPNAHPNAHLTAHLIDKKASIHAPPPVITVDGTGTENIVFVDQKAAAGYPFKVNEVGFFGVLPAFSLPSSEFRNGVFRCFEVEGDSMETTLNAGDWLITRFLDSWEGINDGYVHVVVTLDQVLVKRVINRIKKNGRLILQSDNPLYGNIIVEAEDVKEIWVVKRFFSAILGNRNKQLEAVVNSVVAETAMIKEHMAELERKINRITD